MIQLDEHIFQMGWNQQLVAFAPVSKTCPVYYLPYGVCRFLMRGYTTYNVSFHVFIYTSRYMTTTTFSRSMFSSFLKQETVETILFAETPYTKNEQSCPGHVTSLPGKAMDAQNHFDSFPSLPFHLVLSKRCADLSCVASSASCSTGVRQSGGSEEPSWGVIYSYRSHQHVMGTRYLKTVPCFSSPLVLKSRSALKKNLHNRPWIWTCGRFLVSNSGPLKFQVAGAANHLLYVCCIGIYHLESRWRNSHVLVYHSPLLCNLLGVAPSTFTTV